MLDFDSISIQEMPKDDMLLILEALEYTSKETKVEDFLDLKDRILDELSSLAEVSKDDFLRYLSK